MDETAADAVVGGVLKKKAQGDASLKVVPIKAENGCWFVHRGSGGVSLGELGLLGGGAKWGWTS